MTIHEFDVPEGDPHNEQLAAQAAEDLDLHLGAARDLMAQEAGRVEKLVAMACALDRAEEDMPREKLAALLAEASIRMVGAIPAKVIQFADPYKQCLMCGGWIIGVVDALGPSVLVPCGHIGTYRDLCPSWGPVDGCRCRPVEHAVPPSLTERDELLEAAWGIIANAGQGNWATQGDEWIGAAERWRDRLFGLVAKEKNGARSWGMLVPELPANHVVAFDEPHALPRNEADRG